MNLSRILLMVVSTVFACVAASEQVDTPLQRNPFAAPKVLEQPVTLVAPRRVAEPEPEPEPEPLFRLRAVLAARGGSLANIDGEILGVGEKIEGYRLVAIREHQVVLRRRGKRIVLSVFDDAVAAGRR
jgi:hypothetical protein